MASFGTAKKIPILAKNSLKIEVEPSPECAISNQN